MTQWSNKQATATVQESMQVMLLDKTRPNAKDQNVLATLAMLRNFITGGLPIPPPDTEWVVMPTVTNDPATPFTFAVDGLGEANFPDSETPVTFEAATFTVNPAAQSLEYVFLIYAKSDGTFGAVSGAQAQNPPVPSYPAGALYVSHAIISEAGGQVQEPVSFATLEQVQALLGDYLKLTDSEGVDVVRGQSLIEIYDGQMVFAVGGGYTGGSVDWGVPLPGFEGTNSPKRTAQFIEQGEARVVAYERDGVPVVLIKAGSALWEFYNGKLYLNGVEFAGTPGGGTGNTQATLEDASPVLNFLNPLGHISNEPLTGNRTFSKTGTTLGATVVRAYSADGTSTITFDFAHSVLNSDFVSGQTLAQGDYKLFFSNWGDSVMVSIAQVGAGIEPVPNSAPVITLAGANPMTLTVGDTYTEPGATATDSEDGDISASIVITGGVNTSTAGTYTRYYNVSDSQRLAATQVTRTVQVNAAGTPADTTPPSAPGTPTFSNVTQTSATANWTAATDNVGVAGYNIYLDGVKKN